MLNRSLHQAGRGHEITSWLVSAFAKLYGIIRDNIEGCQHRKNDVALVNKFLFKVYTYKDFASLNAGDFIIRFAQIAVVMLRCRVK